MKFLTEVFLMMLMMHARFSNAFVKGTVPSALRFRSSSTLHATYKDSAQIKANLMASEAIEFKGDVLVLPFYKPCGSSKDEAEISAGLKKMIPAVDPSLKEIVSTVLDEFVFKGEASSKQLIRLYGANDIKYLALVGLGPKSVDGSEQEQKVASKFGKTLAAIAKEAKAETVGVIIPTGMSKLGLYPMMLGVHDEMYTDNRYKKVPEEGFPKQKLQSIKLLGCSAEIVSSVDNIKKTSEGIASGVDFAKDLVGAPPNSKTPVVIAEEAKKIAATYGLEIKVLEEKECKELGMGSYLGVQQGSMFPPQFVHLTYKPTEPDAEVVKVALVGKGLTFDSGGYNLKVGGSGIELMKNDMGGCGAVLGCAKAIAQLKPKNVEVHFITALCENMVSAEAMRPGDILTASNGKTIEVLNTDAEGRLTLADALVYAEKLEVDTIIDLATLTGACVVGLGEKIAGLFSTSEQLLGELEEAASKTNENVWNLPLEMEYKESLKSSLADLKNIAGTKGGGSITAALFLSEFVEKTDWAHIDMAGPVWLDGKATGFGVKMLVEYLLSAKKKKSE